MAKKQQLSQDQLDSLRQALGIESSVPNADLQELAGTKAGQAMLKKIESQPKGGETGWSGFLHDKITGPAEALGNVLYKTVGPGDPAAWIPENISTLGGAELARLGISGIKGAVSPSGAAPKKSPTKKKPAGGSSESESLQAIRDYLTSMVGQGEVAMGVQGQQLAQQNAAVTGTVDQFLTGTSSGNAAVDAAQAAYAKAYSAGEGLQSAAYANMGAANAQYLQSAPMAPIVNLLTQSLGSGQFKELPQSLVQSLPESVQFALAQAGVGETQGTTATPSYGQPIQPPKGGWPKSLTGSTGPSTPSIAQYLQAISNTNPNINTNLNQTLGPGTSQTNTGQ